MSEVIVLGAGPAGLMAALQAAKAGHRCTVLEAAPVVGGMAGSFEVAGQRVDHGSHRLHPATPPELLSLLTDLLGDDLQVRPRAGRIRLGGRWVGFPLRAGNLAATLPVGLSARLIGTSMVGVARRLASPMAGRVESGTGLPEDRRSFDQVVTARFGTTVARQFYGPYARKLYGLSPKELDGELAERRISASSPVDIARRIIRAGRSDGRTFLYPRRGYGQIVERLAEAAEDAGATIHLSTPVSGVMVSDDRVLVTTDAGRHDGTVGLSTIPLTTLAGLIDPGPPPEAMQAMSRARTRAMILVYLVLDQPRYSRFDAHYLPGSDTTVARLSEPKNYRDGDDPSGRTVLCAEIACWQTDDLWQWSADQLTELVVNDLTRVGLPAPEPIHREVKRLGSVYPVFDSAGVADRAIVDRWARSTGRLLTFGRQGLRVIDNLHHVLAMGSAAIEAIEPNGGMDLARWHRSLDGFATNTVED